MKKLFPCSLAAILSITTLFALTPEQETEIKRFEDLRAKSTSPVFSAALSCNIYFIKNPPPASFEKLIEKVGDIYNEYDVYKDDAILDRSIFYVVNRFQQFADAAFQYAKGKKDAFNTAHLAVCLRERLKLSHDQVFSLAEKAFAEATLTSTYSTKVLAELLNTKYLANPEFSDKLKAVYRNAAPRLKEFVDDRPAQWAPVVSAFAKADVEL